MTLMKMATAVLAKMPKPLIFPAITKHRSIVIIAHGFGDSGHGYVPIVQDWQENGLFQDTKFILPSAPSINVTSVSSFIPGLIRTRTASPTDEESAPQQRPAAARSRRGSISAVSAAHTSHLTQQNNDEEGMLQSRDFFLSLIRDEVDKHAVPASQVIMGGFSQGSVMALLTGLTGDVQLGGVFCLCGYLPLADAIRESGGVGERGEVAGKFPHVRKGTDMEVLMVNGGRDPIMNLEWVEKSKNIVKQLGYPVDSSVVPELGHSINQEVLAKVESFIKRVQQKGSHQHDEL